MFSNTSRSSGFVRSTLRGVTAGALGTLGMDAFLYRRYRRGGGGQPFPAWESSKGLTSWDGAPAPARVAKQLLEAALRRDVPPRYARFLNNATHWGFGLANGAVYGLLVGPHRNPRIRSGLPLGAAVWAAGYAVLPRLGVYEHIWKYDRKTLEQDLSAHLVFGTATAAAFRMLTRISNYQRSTR